MVEENERRGGRRRLGLGVLVGIGAIAIVFHLMSARPSQELEAQTPDGVVDGDEIPAAKTSGGSGETGEPSPPSEEPGGDDATQGTPEMLGAKPASEVVPARGGLESGRHEAAPAMRANEEAQAPVKRGPGTDEPEDLPDGEEKGALSREAIQEGIRAMRPIVRACYEATLEDFSEVSGTIALSFEIRAEEGEGRVSMSELDDDRTTLFDDQLQDCMLEAVGDLVFPVPSGGGVVKVTYPFSFRPQQH